ncbi:hypothetical protein F4778DRAFT_787271 [Xylariomycetidae sp. FL2044]|nr:hypothetical protein F4778DRAFT_787271 [Xylariomycetidae sp. FL2044]
MSSEIVAVNGTTVRALSPIQEDHHESSSPVTDGLSVSTASSNFPEDIELPQSADSETDKDILTSPQLPIVMFHADSDTTVKVKVDGQPTQYAVSAAALATASPVWRKTLYGIDATDRTANGELTLDIEGDPKALETIFRIVHYDFGKVPTNPDLEDIYQIAMVTSRYHTTHLTMPWVHKWMDKIIDHATHALCHETCHLALWVAWEFGNPKLFCDMADALIVGSKLHNGKLVNIAGKPLEDMILPVGLLDIITTTRTDTIAKILAIIEEPIGQITGKTVPCTTTDVKPYCKVGHHVRECETLMLGAALQALIFAGIYPVPEVSKFEGSIKELKDLLESLKFIPYIGRDHVPHRAHDHCNLRFKANIETVLKQMDVPLTNEYLDHMASQCEFTGLDKADEIAEYRKQVSNQIDADVVTTDSSTTEPEVSIKEEGCDDGNHSNGGSDNDESSASDVTAKEEDVDFKEEVTTP